MDKPNRKPPKVPTEADWENYEADLDQKWAHDHYCGRTNAEMQQNFQNSPIEAASDLQFMPEIPFRYYMLGYRDYVLAEEFRQWNASAAASCFLGLVITKLEKEPRYIIGIMPELLPAIEYVAQNQPKFDAPQHIYGSFLEKLQRIQALYAECKDRYRG